MSRRDIERELEALGAASTPPPDPGYEDALAQRLHAVGTSLESPSPAPAARRWTWVQPALATAAVLALLAGVALMQIGDEPAGTVGEGVVQEGRTAEEPPDDPAPAPAATEPVRTPRPTPDRTPMPTREPEPEGTPRPERSPETREPLQLACQGAERTGRPVIACRWSATQHPDFAGYRLWRSDGRDRSVVHRTPDRDATAYTDADVSPDVVYTYVVEAFDREGATIATGGPVRAQASGSEPVTQPRSRE